MYAAILLALAGSAVAAPVATSTKAAPKHWAHGYLEEYSAYHTRYIALSCYEQHNSTFFDECCRPMLATETLEANRPAYCVPNASQSESAVAYEATAEAESTASASAEVAAASDYSAWTSSAVASSAAAAQSTPVADVVAAAAPVETSSSSTSEWVAPTTTSTWEAPAQTSEAAQQQSGPSGDVKSGGYATYFYQNGNAGACGTVHGEYDNVVAIDSNGYWGNDFSQGSSYCGRWVTIKNTNNGKTVTAMVADVCPTCNNGNSLDLSVGAFTSIASESDGMVPIEWSFN